MLGPSGLAANTDTLQNHPTCGSQGCTFIQWSGSAADGSYAAPVNGTIVAWRIASGSASNKVKLRILRPAGSGKYSAVASSSTQTTSGSSSGPDQFSASIPVKAGDIIGLDNANSALIFKTGVSDAFPELWTPPLPDGGSPSAPTPPVGTTTNGYQLQIDAYLQPTHTTTTPTTTTTTTTPTTTTVTTATTVTTPTTTAGRTSLEVTNVRLKSSWRHSRLNGRVQFSVKVQGASHLTALVKDAGDRTVRGERNYDLHQAGTFVETLRLSPATPPGSYVVRVFGATGTSAPAVVEAGVRLKAPPEGIVDRASISLARGGHAGSSFRSPQKQLWVRFHFLATPTHARSVRIVWRTPGFKLVGAVSKRVASTIDSSLGSSAPLAVGRWYAIISVDGTVVKQVGVRIT